ncbi:hypothetical protein, partial [Asanoa sp. NPDC050611]|uniref:TolB family protein n=1 Tax=Asanoa sp. NPDC050611 TaxID=3157098 RepID=UPI0033E7F3F5
GTESQAGEDTVLSADGRRIAVWSDTRVKVVDLVTGRARRASSGVDGTVRAEPSGWSPDGTALVVRDTVPVDEDGTGYRSVLTLVRLDGGGRVRLAETDHDHELGSPVAFAPGRLAFQSGRTVVVSDLDGRRLSSFTLARDDELAGKGAWNGDTLTVARRVGYSWSLRRIDPGTGRDLGALDLPAVPDVTAIRLLGWRADGSALVAAFVPADPAPAAFDVPTSMNQRLAYGSVGTTQVLALHRGASAPATLLTAPAGVVGIDVAESLLRAGRTRVANPPTALGPRFWLWTFLIPLLLAGLVAYRCRKGIALRLDDRRVRRARGR